MAHVLPVPIPCPVQLGSVKGDSVEAELHEYVRQGNYVKVKKLLKKGVFVDAVNSMGQTSLFIAAFLGLGKIVDVLLDYGSDANHRCYDGSTPVHAAAFSGNQWILSKLLDEGGDLRVHDKDGRNPQCWAMSAGKESSAQMLEFIQRCAFHMQAAVQNFPSDLLRKAGSSKALVCSPSRFGGLVQGNADSPLGRFLKGEANAAKNICSFGFGKFYLAGSGHLGYLASLPIIGEKDVVQADDEPTFSYPVGPYMMMTNLMWGGSRVTVKELSFEPHQNCSKLRLADLLIAEQEHSSKLRHPHLLQLMSVCLSSNLEKTRLVYERVNFGSLYSILHERRTEFPVLHMETILHVLLQISDALRFLHSRGFIHRSLTSYAIQIVSSGEAKLCNLEYMIESKDHGEHSDLTRIPVPVQLYKWCSPEVILEKVVTVKSDIYSFCTVVQEALTETPPWKGLEDSSIEKLIISGQQLETDVRLPVPYYNIVNSGLEPKQKNRSVKLQDIQYILKNDLKDLTKFQTGHADGLSKAQGPTVFADVNICLTSAFSYRKRTQELQGEEITKADSPAAPRHSLFPEENSAVVDHEAPTSPQPVAQDKSPDVASELPATLSVSDADDSLCSFEINEIFASYPELHKDFLEEGARLGETLQDEKGQRKEEDKAALRDLCASPGVHGEEKPLDEEGEFLELGTEYATEEEESISETSDLCTLAQVRRMSSLSQNELYISKCVLDLKIIQSLVQQAADSLRRTEEKLDKLEATEKQKKLLQEIGTNQLSEQIVQDRHWNRSDDTSQNINNPFSGVSTFLWKAIGPPSSVYIPPLVTCQAEGTLCADSFQAASKAAKEMEAIKNEKWKCFHEMRTSNNENNHHDLSFSVVKSLDDQVSLGHEHLLPRVSGRCKKKFDLQCQRGGDSHSAASGSEEEKWCCPKSRSEIYSTKISEEGGLMQSEWRTEVKQMARRVASGQLELSSPYPAGECTSESEAESIKEAFQHLRIQKSQGQQSYRWQTGDNVELWDLSSEDRSEYEESDLESAFRSPGGRSCQSPSQDEQAESGIVIRKNSVFPQQVENPSRTWNAQGKLEEACEGFLQKQFPEDAGSGVQVSGGKMLFCSTAAQNSGNNTQGVNQLIHVPVASSSGMKPMPYPLPWDQCAASMLTASSLQHAEMLSGITSSCCMGCFCLEEQSSPRRSPSRGFRGSEEPPACSSAFHESSRLCSCSRFPSVRVRAATAVSAALPHSLEEPNYQTQGASVVKAAQEGTLWEPWEERKEKDVSVSDIQDLSSIPYEQENYYRDTDCKTPRVSRTPSVSTPLTSEGKIPVTFEKCKHRHEVASDYSFCGSQELSSAASRTFATAYEEERNTEIPSASGVCSSELNKPEGLPVVASTLRSTKKTSALSQASNHCTDELPPPAQELLDEIDYLKQQESIAQDFKEKGLYDCGVQINVPDQMKMEDRESEKESERNEKRNDSLWTKDSFHLAEETERAHSTLDDVLERMLHSVPGDEEIQEQPQGHTLGAASLRDPEDVGGKKGVEEGGAGARGGAPESCAASSEDRHPEDQKLHLQKQLASSSPFRIIVLDQSSPA